VAPGPGLGGVITEQPWVVKSSVVVSADATDALTSSPSADMPSAETATTRTSDSRLTTRCVQRAVGTARVAAAQNARNAQHILCIDSPFGCESAPTPSMLTRRFAFAHEPS
jgi:hypothetical protein